MYHKKYDWTVFTPQADEWLIAYSLPPALHFVKLFMIGHAVELYLKAVVTKQNDDIALAIGQSHKIKKLWDLCKQDPAFMLAYEIRQSVLGANLFAPEVVDLNRELSEDDHKHYEANAELYAVAKLLPNLKYWSTPLKEMPDGFRVSWLFPNPYWIGFFKELRSYLQLPLPNTRDSISYLISRNELPAESASYLTGLYQ